MFEKPSRWIKVAFDWMKAKKLLSAAIIVASYMAFRYAGILPDWIPAPVKDIFKQVTSTLRFFYLKAVSDVVYMVVSLAVGAVMAALGYKIYKKKSVR